MSIHDILKQPIEKDLLEHFIKYITMVQDWEFIRVLENKDEGVVLEYCYRREEDDKEKDTWKNRKEEGDKEKGTWKKCDPKSQNTEKCKDCDIEIDENKILKVKELRDILVDSEKKHIPYGEISFGKGHKHKALLEDIFTEKYIPELDEYDKSECENKIVIYEYPSYTIIPDNEPKEHKLGLFYERQQIDILRQLAIKHKVMLETIRHSTRAAVAAIMGRNMSHNIGSHVLSYLSENEGFGFLKYLQGRADFLAEISTTKPRWTTQKRLINDIINPFVYSDITTRKGELLDNIGRSVYINRNYLDASRIKITVFLNEFKVEYNYSEGRFAENPSIKKIQANNSWQPVGIEELKDFVIDVPHGVMGSHALYSILENFIRNSVKHNAEGIKEKLNEGNFKLEVNIKVNDVPNEAKLNQNKKFEGLIKIRLYDNISEYSEKAKKDIEKYINVDEDGKLVKDNGSLKGGGGWGIKEMRLSSAWLRNTPPEDIQFKDEDPPLIKLDKEGAMICYEFYLLKPFNVLLVDDTKGLKGDSNKGIYIASTLKDVEDLLDSGKLRHRFIVFNISGIEEWLNDDQLLRLPARVFVVNGRNTGIGKKKVVCITSDEYKSIISKEDFLLTELYKKWIEYVYNSGDFPQISVINETGIDNAINSLDKSCLPIINKQEQIILEHGASALTAGNPIYWEPFSTGAGKGTLGGKLKLLTDQQSDIISKLRTVYEIYEAALASIVIIDERLFTKVDKIITFINVTTRIYELLEKLKIEVINLGKVNDELFVYRKGSSLKWDEYIKNKNIAFLSIHQTIIKDIGEDIFRSKIVSSDEIRHVIIHSGRGSVDITPGFKFVEFSNIDNLIIDAPDKHLLTDLFMNIKGGINEQEGNNRNNRF